MNFIHELSQILCTPENMARAQEYIKSRGINLDKIKYPCALTDGDESLYRRFANQYPTNIFINSLYIPILDIENPNMLAGFDVRYIGTETFRTRFHKFKINQDTMMMYFSKKISDIGDREPIIVTEGVIDAWSIEQLGYTVISPLTALNTLKFGLFLHAISERVYLMYDTDSTGRRALSKFMKNTSMDMDLRESFKPIIYSGKDPNVCLMNMGESYLKDVLRMQVGEPNKKGV